MYYVGSPALFEEMEAANFNDAIKSDVKTLQEQGKTVMVAGTKNTVQAIIAVADEVRESSKEIIQNLHQAGIKKTVMLTGDNHSTVRAIGSHVGVTDIQSELHSKYNIDEITQI